jgi:hypothetical protein
MWLGEISVHDRKRRAAPRERTQKGTCTSEPRTRRPEERYLAGSVPIHAYRTMEGGGKLVRLVVAKPSSGGGQLGASGFGSCRAGSHPIRALALPWATPPESFSPRRHRHAHTPTTTTPTTTPTTTTKEDDALPTGPPAWPPDGWAHQRTEASRQRSLPPPYRPIERSGEAQAVELGANSLEA